MTGRFALIIAAEEYADPKFNRLRAPARDAEELAGVLRDPKIGGFDVTAVINGSVQQVREDVERFFSHREPEDLLLLYFACHGVKDQRGRLYLAMSDTTLELLAARGLAAQYINEQLEACRSRRVVLVLDCCYSGAYARGFAPRSDVRVGVCERFEGRGRVVLTASDALEYAFEENDLKSENESTSVFTSAVIRGLKTGDADIDRDGQVSVDDLYTFTFNEVRSRTPNQTPGKVDMVRGSIYLAANPRMNTIPVSASADPFQAARSETRWEREEGALELRKIADDPGNVMAQAARAALEQLSSDHERLVRASALASLGQVTISNYERGLVLAGAGDLLGADAEFQRVIESGSADIASCAHFNRGVLAASRKDTEAAISHYTAAIESGQPLAAPRSALNLACFYDTFHNTERAMELYGEAMRYEDAEVQPRAAFLLARLHEQRGDHSTAWLLYAAATDYRDHPFVSAARHKYELLMPLASGRDVLTRLFSLAGYEDPDSVASNYLKLRKTRWRIFSL